MGHSGGGGPRLTAVRMSPQIPAIRHLKESQMICGAQHAGWEQFGFFLANKEQNSESRNSGFGCRALENFGIWASKNAPFSHKTSIIELRMSTIKNTGSSGRKFRSVDGSVFPCCVPPFLRYGPFPEF